MANNLSRHRPPDEQGREERGVVGMGELTREQFEAALKLAAEYGHEWGQAVYGSYFRRGEFPKGFPVNVEEIRAWTESQRPAYFEPWMAGISAPVVDVVPGFGPVVYHTTGTGRVTWRVYKDGSAVIEVSRPAGVVLRARVTNGAVEVEKVRLGIPIHERHVKALKEAVRALVPGWEPDLGAIGEVLPDEDYVEAYEEDEE